MPVLTQASHMLPVGGDAGVKKSKLQPIPMGNIVKTIQDGNTTVIFCDDYVERTLEGQARVLQQFEDALWNIVDSLRKAGEDV